ncbi:MAG: hypothetical protein ACJ74W_10375 [Pyrinomonadaceae bacterium]
MGRYTAQFPAHAYLATCAPVRSPADVARFKARLLQDAVAAVTQYPERKPAHLSPPAAQAAIEAQEFDAFLERAFVECRTLLLCTKLTPSFN